MGTTATKDKDDSRESEVLTGINDHEGAFQRLTLDPRLLDQFQSLPMFTAEQSDQTAFSFAPCRDYDLPAHVYFEGYFHSLNAHSPVPSLNPRTGAPIDKPPAPPVLVAFFAAFREMNAHVLNRIVDQTVASLSASGGAHDQPSRSASPAPDTWDETRSAFVEAIEASIRDGGTVASDLSAQIHAGDAVDGRNLGWHCDAMNSALHVSLTLGGSRTLLSHLSPPRDPRAPNTPNHSQRQHQPIEVDLRPGDVYISNPSSFMHAIIFPHVSWGDRSIAIQARLLLPCWEHLEALSCDKACSRALAAAVSGALRGGCFLLPNADDVEARLAGQQGDGVRDDDPR